MPITLKPLKQPNISPDAYVDPAAVIRGDVTIAAGVSIWPGVVARGDMHFITIGEGTNIQDNAVLHVTPPYPGHPDGHSLIIGSDVVVGHGAILHGCQIHDHSLIGMGAIVLDGAVIDSNVYIGAGSVVAPGKHLTTGLWLGNPARFVRALTEYEIAAIDANMADYRELFDVH